MEHTTQTRRHGEDTEDCGIEIVDPPLRIAPDSVGVAVTVHDSDLLATSYQRLGVWLPPEFSRAVAKRRADYIAGRYCGARALALLGLPGNVRIARDENGSPRWPDGIVGSITHTYGFAWAAVARATDVPSIGIDSERIMSADTRAKIERDILGKHEAGLRARGDVAQAFSPEEYVTLVFSAKESLLKCIYPISGVLLAPQDIRIRRVDMAAQMLGAAVTADAFPKSVPREHPVRFALRQPFVHTATVLRFPGC